MLTKIALTLLLLPALIYAARLGVADFLRLAPSAYVEAMQSGTEGIEPERLIESRERLLLARSWDAGNPLIPEYLGQIAYIRAQLSPLSPSVQLEFLREAIADFDAAIALRGHSGNLWASRMSAGLFFLDVSERAERGDESRESELAAVKLSLRRAAELGPWEPSVLRHLVRLGSRSGIAFTAEERQILDAAAVRAIRLGLNR